MIIEMVGGIIQGRGQIQLMTVLNSPSTPSHRPCSLLADLRLAFQVSRTNTARQCGIQDVQTEKILPDAIPRIRPRNELSPAVGHKITATLLQWNPGIAPDCWICAKSVEWLEAVYEGIYLTWSAQLLQAEYSSRSDIGFTDMRQGAVIYMAIRPPSLAFEYGCTVCLKIIFPNGRSPVVFSN